MAEIIATIASWRFSLRGKRNWQASIFAGTNVPFSSQTMRQKNRVEGAVNDCAAGVSVEWLCASPNNTSHHEGNCNNAHATVIDRPIRRCPRNETERLA
jgi:hypothetical protein